MERKMTFDAKIGLNIVLFILFLLPMQAFGEDTPGLSISLETSADALCTANPFIMLRPVFQDDGSLGDTKTFMYEYSSDGNTWKTFYTATSAWGYSQRPVNLKEGWYRVSVCRTGDEENPEKWISCEPVFLQKTEGGCTPFRYPWQDEISDDVCPQGTLLFREDFGGNDPSDPITSQKRLTTMSQRYIQRYDVMTHVSSGLYIVAKRGWQNNLQSSTTNGLYSQWFIQDDHTYPNDYTRGYLLEVDGIGGNDAFYSTTFPVCHELDLSFSAYVANVLEPGHDFARPKVRFIIQDDVTGDTILEQSSGPIAPAPSDYGKYGHPLVQSAPWHLVGASFHVPEGVSLLRLSIFNDEIETTGNDFAMDDIEIRLCKPQVAIDAEPEICMDSAFTFRPFITPDGGFQEPYQFLWQFSKDSLPYDSEEWINIGRTQDLTFDSARLSQTGWYRFCLTSDGIDIETERYCRAVSKPVRLTVNDCTPPCPELQTIHIDTVVCDTLMPFLWHDTLCTTPTTFHRMLRNRYGCDSILYIYSLDTEVCCPPMRTYRTDTIVCDTLMPFLWHDTLFTIPGTYEIILQNSRGCDSALCIYSLNTEVCCPPLRTAERDTVVCDTIMPFLWNDLLFDSPGSQTSMLHDTRGCDSLETTWTLSTEICCYDLQFAPRDTAVCDTLLPFTWYGVLFADPDEQEVLEYSPRGCDSILHIYSLDTFHCERLYPIIVNKYNWQLLCDNIALRRLFPERTATHFQWYKDEDPVPGANEDDYAERNRLYGKFQLYVTLDHNESIWSNIIEIYDSCEEEPVRLRIFDSRGYEVSEQNLSHGIYLFRFEQGPNIWTEKRLIP